VNACRAEHVLKGNGRGVGHGVGKVKRAEKEMATV